MLDAGSTRFSVARTGDYTEAEVSRFYDEAHGRSLMAKHARPSRQKCCARRLAPRIAPLLRYPTIRPTTERSTVCLVTQDYPPGQNGGIARNMAQLARSLAADGHHVHVLTRARGAGTVDFEDGVWVRRLQIRPQPMPVPRRSHRIAVPGHIWDYGQTMLEEVCAIDAKRRIDVVYSPLWDCEPLAFVLSGKFPTIVALQTTMRFWLESQPLKSAGCRMDGRVRHAPILALEELILEKAPMIHANSRAIVEDIRARYHLTLPEERLFYSPQGWRTGLRAWNRWRAIPTRRDSLRRPP